MAGSAAASRRAAAGRASSPAQRQAGLAARLNARRPEIEQAALGRIHTITDPSERSDPECADGLRHAVSAALDYGLAAVEAGEERRAPPPPVLLVQARMAARAGVSLDTILRRYFTGYALLGDFLMDEVEAVGLRGAAYKRILRTQVTLFERLIAEICDEYAREASRASTVDERRAEQIDRLLAGELLDTSPFSYDFEGVHIALVAKGSGVAEAIRDLSAALDLRLLMVKRDADTVWAWVGSRHSIDPDGIASKAASGLPPQAVLTIGEPGAEFPGWRLSHRQAKAAFTVALRSGEKVVRYCDVALISSVLQDEVLATSLRRMYIAPLADGRDGGTALRESLRAYFAAERNVSSAAAALGVSRQAVAKRLRIVEAKLSRPLGACETELDAALRLDAIDAA